MQTEKVEENQRQAKSKLNKLNSDRPVFRIADKDLVENVIRTTQAIHGIDPDYFKVFAIGFNKTATTSISKVFENAGFSVMDGPHWRRSTDMHILYQFQAFSDGPPEDFKLLDQKFPRSRFVLNVRDLDEWMDSRIEHIRFRMEAGTHKPRTEWKMSNQAYRSWVLKRNKHHVDVLKYFQSRPQDLLVVNFIRDPNAVTKLCRFIGASDEGMETPYERSTPKTRESGVLRNAEAIATCLTKLGIAESEWSNDIYCPSLEADTTTLPADTSHLPDALA